MAHLHNILDSDAYFKINPITRQTVYKKPNEPSVLVLGNSYSQIGYWIDQLKNLVHLGDIVNLGVSSASLKDKYTDREKYPYNDRPVSNDTRGGNVNTLGSQVEKLKRLMLGEDLDDGEVKVYEHSSPDIILIEGEQIKYAASLLGIPVIDWGTNGRLSLCDNVVTGSGTSSDPYIFDAAGEYSLDSLHPNKTGAHFLAMEVAKVLHGYNLVEYKDE